MKTRGTFIFFAVLFLGIGGALAAFHLWPPRRPDCFLCRRPVHPPTAFSVTVDGKKIWACCPRCGCAAYHGAAQEPEATDYATGLRFPAEKCVYVCGSDLTPCCSPDVIVVGEKVPCCKCFDRCYPSAIAFASAKDALEFSSAHGGNIVPFERLLGKGGGP